MTVLRLIAEDLEDLLVLSAHLQDAAFAVGDMTFLPSTRRFVALATRPSGAKSAVRIEGVRNVRSKGFSTADSQRRLTLACLDATQTATGVELDLVFQESCRLRLEADSIDLLLEDLDHRHEIPGHAKPGVS